MAYDVSFAYQSQAAAQVTGDTGGTEPTTGNYGTLTATITGARQPATGEILRFYTSATPSGGSATPVSWQYTVQAGDTFAAGVDFTVGAELGTTLGSSPVFANNKVYSNFEWKFS